jgi:3-oxoacyl-[acyl-carrier-protein] synthase-3
VKISGVGILALGISLPKQVRKNSDWPSTFSEESRKRRHEDIGVLTAELLDRAETDETVAITIEELSKYKDDPFRGAIERRVLEKGRHSSDLEMEAAKEALANAGIAASDIDVLLVYSSIQDLCTPNNGGILHHRLGMSPNSPAIGVETACGSLGAQIRLGSSLIMSGSAKYVLLVQSSAPSRVMDYLDPQSPTVGDAATAVLLGPSSKGRGLQSIVSIFNGRYHKVVAIAPAGKRGGAWYSGEDGRLLLRSLDYKGIGETMIGVGKMARDSIQMALDEAGTKIADVSFFASHQTLAAFIPICQRSAGLSHAKTMNTFSTIGSVLACSIPINLYHGMKEGLLKSDDTVALFTTGAGMSWNSGIVRWEI